MTAFLLLGSIATDPALEEMRALLRVRGDVLGSAAGRAEIVVAELPAGARAVPGEVAERARSCGASGLLLWTREPLTRPVNALGAGNVVLASPSCRQHVLAALDLLLGAPASSAAGQQALHRAFWLAWTKGSTAAPLTAAHSEDGGATLAVTSPDARAGDAASRARRALTEAPTEARRAALLREQLGATALVAHLSPDTTHWLAYWPAAASPLWLYSPQRMPARWSVSASLAASGLPMVRLPAFSGDLLVAAHLEEGAVPALLSAMPQGALEVHRVLEAAAKRPDDWGFVVEVR